MSRSVYSNGRDRGTFTGGYDFAIRRMEREGMDAYAVGAWHAGLFDTPTDERNQFWAGMRCALSERLGALRGVAA